jgi:hypothetical protein
MSDRSGVMRELMFIVNRRCKLNIDASLPAWLNWAQSQPDHSRPHYLTMSFAQKNPVSSSGTLYQKAPSRSARRERSA